MVGSMVLPTLLYLTPWYPHYRWVSTLDLMDALGGHKELVETLLAARCDAMQGDGGATQMGELWTSWPLNRWEMMG